MTQHQLLSEKVGSNLKIFIKNSKYKTQEKFAVEGMHVDPVTVRRWIAHGVRDIDTICEIALTLEVDLKELFK